MSQQYQSFSIKRRLPLVNYIAILVFVLMLVLPGMVKSETLEYCEAQANRPWNAWISGVEFAGINHQLNKKNRYAFFSDESAEIKSGTSEPIIVTSSLSWIREVLHYKVWIDFNQDGVFDPENEVAAYVINPQTIYGAPKDSMHADITIPGNAVQGDTRMRISTAWNEEPTPCGTHESGEVNDFTVNITAGDDINTNLAPIAVLISSATSGMAPLTLSLDASLSSDPDGSITSVNWDFGDGNAATNTSYEYTYTEPGTYIISLQVIDDHGTTATDSIEITVISENSNQAPVANISASTISGLVPLTVNLDASASTDTDGMIVDYDWTFTDEKSSNTITSSNTYTTAGTYEVLLTVTDNQGDIGTSTISINVQDNGAPVTSVSVAIAQGKDDAEEKSDGNTNTTSSDLEMVQESQTQLIGLRFANTPVPKGATIVSAWLQFTADEDDDQATSLSISGEKTGNSFSFDNQDFYISSRNRTNNSSSWSPAAWDAPDSGAAQKSTDLSSVVQEIIDTHEWQAGNAMSFIIDGEGKRVAVSYNKNQQQAAVLHIQYQGGEISTSPANLTRGPYLQILTEDSVIIRWRTDQPGNSMVKFGLSETEMDQIENTTSATTEHEISLTGLTPDTRYYYNILSSDEDLLSSPSYFETAPLTGSTDPVRIWVIGDAGRANFAQESVYSAYLDYAGNTHTDAWLMLGDNAYGDGNDTEYQSAVFDIYPEMLARTALWPSFGNHDAHSSKASNETGPYYEMFSLPTRAEAGGVASGKEAYYSYDYGNIHFICLNSSPSGTTYYQKMFDWLEDDLANNSQTWTIAYMHHPPYSKGSHDSDTSNTLTYLRQELVPILENHGVDLLLTGHSHSYERSFLIDGHYGLSTSFDASMLKSNHQNEYQKPVTKTPRSGVIYAVAGASGSLNNAPLGHPIMAYDEVKLGSMVIDINDLELRARYIDNAGEVRDEFTITKIP